MLVRVAAKDSETVISALIKQAHKLPRELNKSLTWDRGCEMAKHKRFSLATDVKVYFCDPQQPWQRGSNENANGLLTAVLPESNGPVGHQSDQAQRGSATAKRATQRNAPLRSASRTLCPMCCVDRLNPQPEADTLAASLVT